MPAPSPALVETDPEELTPSSFPFRIDPFPAQQLATFDGVLNLVAPPDAPVRPATP